MTQNKFSKVFDIDLYRKADREVVELVLDNASRAGFYVESQAEWLYWADRKLSDFSWTPDFQAQYFMERRPGFEFIFLAHHVMHYLCRPPASGNSSLNGGYGATVLLGENLACNLDGYFTTKLVQHYGVSLVQKKFGDRYPFTMIQANAKRSGTTEAKVLKAVENRDPLELYKDLVGETTHRQNIYREVGNLMCAADRVPKSSVEVRVTKRSAYELIANFDYELHNRFTDFNEGWRSTTRDLKFAAALNALLVASSTMPEFLKRLSEKTS